MNCWVIIGKSGQKIKEIRPQSSGRCVKVTGSLEKVVLALQQIFLLVANTDIKGYDNHYDPNNFDAFYANDNGGYGGMDNDGSRRGRGKGWRERGIWGRQGWRIWRK